MIILERLPQRLGHVASSLAHEPDGSTINGFTASGFEKSIAHRYGDHPMDLADASVIVAAESLRTTKVFTLDLADFQRYRIRRGHRHIKVEILGQ